MIFLVISTSRNAFMSLPSHFKLSFIFLPHRSFSFDHVHVLRHTQSWWLSPTIVSAFQNILLFLWVSDVCFSSLRKLADWKEHILIIRPCDISCRRSAINMHTVTSEHSCLETPTINNCIEQRQVAALFTRSPNSIKLHSWVTCLPRSVSKSHHPLSAS